ncbi:hypothetical protein ACFWTE_13025 [Nocardiopsis sp. NPDC058631]|uniref:hypothetical protein n=1 Tax=Nocardiopsis sp. NPDC058631 TaxID=3346566 RepID=UPI00364B5F79
MSASAPPLSIGIRTVLDAPRGHRFSRPQHPPAQTREQRLLNQMRGNPRVDYRLRHGVLPAWMETHDARLTQSARVSRSAARPPLPRPRSHRRVREGGGLGLALCCHTLAAALGAFAHHVLSPLL